jgi:hypothetical protein
MVGNPGTYLSITFCILSLVIKPKSTNTEEAIAAPALSLI